LAALQWAPVLEASLQLEEREEPPVQAPERLELQ